MKCSILIGIKKNELTAIAYYSIDFARILPLFNVYEAVEWNDQGRVLIRVLTIWPNKTYLVR